MLTGLGTTMKKELRQTFRDKRIVLMLTGIPLIQLIFLGFAVNLEVEDVRTVVADEDHSPESRAFLDGLTAGDAFLKVGGVRSADAAQELVAAGEAKIALVVPVGFGRDLAHGRPTAVQVLVDGSDSNTATIAASAVTTYALQRAMANTRGRLEALAGQSGAAISVSTTRVEPRILYNPTLASRIYFVPGVAASLLLLVTMIVTAMGLAREKEGGTLEQVLVTPLSTTTLILGKTLPYAVIGLFDLAIVVTAGAWIFDVPVRGSLPLLFFGGSLYLLTTLGMGLLMSAIARTQQQAFMGAFFFVMPAILLSGFVTPVENMPAWLQPLTNFDPMRHFVEIMRAVLLKDASLAEMGSQLVALAGIGLTVFSVSAAMLKRRLV